MARVALFEPCYLAALRPADNDNARRVLEALGDTVTSIEGRCCGQPGYNSGFRNEARTVGRQLLTSVGDRQLPSHTIVGVVDDVRFAGWDLEPEAAIYAPYSTLNFGSMPVAFVRTAGATGAGAAGAATGAGGRALATLTGGGSGAGGSSTSVSTR